jgi:hypothetical protein
MNTRRRADQKLRETRERNEWEFQHQETNGVICNRQAVHETMITKETASRLRRHRQHRQFKSWERQNNFVINTLKMIDCMGMRRGCRWRRKRGRKRNSFTDFLFWTIFWNYLFREKEDRDHKRRFLSCKNQTKVSWSWCSPFVIWYSCFIYNLTNSNFVFVFLVSLDSPSSIIIVVSGYISSFSVQMKKIDLLSFLKGTRCCPFIHHFGLMILFLLSILYPLSTDFVTSWISLNT